MGSSPKGTTQQAKPVQIRSVFFYYTHEILDLSNKQQQRNDTLSIFGTPVIKW